MAFTLSFDASTAAGLSDLNTFLQSRSYVVGFQATQTDVALFNAIGKAPEKAKYPNVWRFYSHIASFSDAQRAAFPGGIGSSSAAVATSAAKPAAGGKKPAADDDDDDSLFGDSDEDDGAAAAAAAKAAAARAAAKKPAKKKVIEKSSVIIEVKPMEAGQDMGAMEADVRKICPKGLEWGAEAKVVDVAFGIQKLVMQAVIIDEECDLDDFLVPIEELEGVQSVDMLSMSKV